MFIRINGVLHYLWRAVDQHGVVLDILVRVPSSDTAHVIDVCRYGQIQLTSWDNALDLGRPGHCLIIADQDDGLMPPRTVAAISVGKTQDWLNWPNPSNIAGGDFIRNRGGTARTARIETSS